MSISPARYSAFDILKRIETEAAYSSVLLPEYEAKLSPSDRGLCHELVLGVLRRQIWLDRAIDLLTGNKKLDLAVRLALRLGLYQLRFLDKVPPHAAVSESVDLVGRAKKMSAKGLVNAVLRRAVTESPSVQPRDEIDRIVVETSHPRWLVQRWVDQFGEIEAAAIAAANNYPQTVAFRHIGRDFDVNSIAGATRPSEYVNGCLLADKISPELREMSLQGSVYFQDEASQMVAHSVEVPPRGRFLDVCAAPGGKTGLIAANATNVMITAGDLHRSRVEFLKANLARQGCDRVSVVQYNAESGLPFSDGSFGTVLVDAPCSGTGTIRRNPEIRYAATQTDLAELSAKQLRILVNASKLVSSGGLLVYSTCSLERDENESVAGSFGDAEGHFARIGPDVPSRFITAEGYARTWPHRDGMDGFFIAAFQRIAQ
ncbi:MAG: 16S rRNA (cytosine(967)-C(5))-methyltransferase RsmB [Chloracidobacterium sp.]|nr:16S rRNA (cytosine(967)-C(5))-methyltransferase RsmB [Chloracidobacterium sp.]